MVFNRNHCKDGGKPLESNLLYSKIINITTLSLKWLDQRPNPESRYKMLIN